MRVGIAALCWPMCSASSTAPFWRCCRQCWRLDIGATAENLASASGLWFLAFALMQIPVGVALDRIGPR